MPQVIGKRGQLVKISLERNNKTKCSWSCKGLYRVGAECFCHIIEDHMPVERPIECIKMQINKNIKVKGFKKCCDTSSGCDPYILNGIPTCHKGRTNEKTILVAKCVILED